jgi:hypothetical protein
LTGNNEGWDRWRSWEFLRFAARIERVPGR